MDAAPTPPLRAAWLGLAVLALALRADAFLLPPHPDEVFTLVPTNRWQDALSEESAVNPPLWRLTFSFLGHGWTALLAGRLTSLVAGVLSVPAVAVLAHRASGGAALPSLLAGLLLAVHPEHAYVSTWHRTYATAGLLALGHLLALSRCLGDEVPPRPARAVTTVTAAVLPWLHYAFAPPLAAVALLALARRPRLGLSLYAPGALLSLPLVAFVLSPRVAPTDGPWPDPATVVDRALGGSKGLAPVAALVTDLVPPLGAQPLWPFTLLVGVVLCVLAWRWSAGREGRFAVAWTLASMATVFLGSGAHLVRESLAVLSGITWPIVLAATWSGPPPRLRAAAIVALCVVYEGELMMRWDVVRTFQASHAAARDVLASTPAWRTRRLDRTVFVHPETLATSLYFEVHGQGWTSETRDAGLAGAGYPHSFRTPEGSWAGVPPDRIDDAHPFRGELVLWAREVVPAGLLACEALASGEGWTLRDCAGRATQP